MFEERGEIERESVLGRENIKKEERAERLDKCFFFSICLSVWQVLIAIMIT